MVKSLRTGRIIIIKDQKEETFKIPFKMIDQWSSASGEQKNDHQQKTQDPFIK